MSVKQATRMYVVSFAGCGFRYTTPAGWNLLPILKAISVAVLKSIGHKLACLKQLRSTRITESNDLTCCYRLGRYDLLSEQNYV